MLENIHSPRDLDGLTYDQMNRLAEEIRKEKMIWRNNNVTFEG